MKTRIFAFAAAAALIATPAFADLAQELSTAQTHAGLASTATDIAKVQMHLHHAVNCLVGPASADFDAAAGNPCGKAGNGAIPDSTDAAQKAKLADIVTSAKAGFATTDLATAQKTAKDTADAVAAAK